jgi:cytochrome c oxidase subunit 1
MVDLAPDTTAAIDPVDPTRPAPSGSAPKGSAIVRLLTTTDHKTIGIMYITSG